MFSKIFLAYFCIIVCSGLDLFGPNCIMPPLLCPNENITFWLYTRSNRDNPKQIHIKDLESIHTAPWVKGAPIKILIHGYTGHKDFSPNTEIRPAYLECCDYNIISVDYNKVAQEPCYMHAAFNTELVGMCTAQLIDELVNQGFALEDFHVIGFSLGAQTAGYVANYLKSGMLDRITALDPALPLFVTMDKDRKIDSSDAKFVDVLHTNSLEKGKLETSGHIDFFANGGVWQPGCKADGNYTKSGCNHARAPKYYSESLTTDKGFYGLKCFSWLAYIIGWCDIIKSDEEVLFGEYVNKNATGAYFFTTNNEPPYAQGPTKSTDKLNDQNEVTSTNAILSALTSLFFG